MKYLFFALIVLQGGILLVGSAILIVNVFRRLPRLDRDGAAHREEWGHPLS